MLSLIYAERFYVNQYKCRRHSNSAALWGFGGFLKKHFLQGWNTSNFDYDKKIVNINSLASFLRQTIQGIFYVAHTRIPEISEVKE